MTFKIALLEDGPDPDHWSTIASLIGQADVSFNPDASFNPQAEVVGTQAGTDVGRGFATARWYWAALTLEQRAILKEFCPNVSSQVYIETQTNEIDLDGERIWIQAQAVMKWPQGDEDQQAEKSLGLEIIFTHLVEVE